MNKYLLLVVFILSLFTSCLKKESMSEYEYVLSEKPIILEKFNSPFDDFRTSFSLNSSNEGMIFSSNRKTIGASFDIEYKHYDISNNNGSLKIIYTEEEINDYQNKLLTNINTSSSCEIGPYSYFENNKIEYTFYANNSSGPFNLMYSYAESESGDFNGDEVLYGPFLLESINTSSNDYFPTINSDKSALYFCSSIDSKFDIYSLKLNNSQPLKDYLPNSSSSDIVKDLKLSSNQNDRCPSITGNYMVFCSDRDGGYGGFDLYFSKFENGEWSDPENFGENVNTEYDDYAPVILNYNSSSVLFFSSNKPGGQGRYDLYAFLADSYLE